MSCPGCGAVCGGAARFCEQCGLPLPSTCPGCGRPRVAAARFCADCGTPLSPATQVLAPGSDQHLAVDWPVSAHVAERRLVSVLFADLVGFTQLSESRDPEDVRELLSRYFDVCRARSWSATAESWRSSSAMR